VLAAISTNYVGFKNGPSKTIVSIRKPIQTFSTGGQLVTGRCLYSNKVNDTKDLFLPCEHRPSFSKLVNRMAKVNVSKSMNCHYPRKTVKQSHNGFPFIGNHSYSDQPWTLYCIYIFDQGFMIIPLQPAVCDVLSIS
jgi:hypothetical protein